MNPVFKLLFRGRIEDLLRIDPESKPEVYIDVFDGADIQNVNYWLELLLSAGIATLGLVLNSPAVVIGAMLVSPLMGPLIAAGLAFAAADLYLGIKSGLQLAMSLAASVLFAALIVWVLPLDTPTPEIQARTQPNLLDLGVALFSGLAGSLLVSRSRSTGGGGAAALPGVAIAVALMPPLCVIGFGLGAGFVWSIMYGASLLFLTNLAAIVFSGFMVFALLRMGDADVRLAIARPLLERAGKDSIYGWLERRTSISKSFANIGKFQWRLLMLLAVVALLWPLSRAMIQLTRELVARDAVEDAVHLMVPDRESIISERINIHSDPISVWLVVADEVDPELVKQAEKTVILRARREAQFVVRKVAGAEELARLQDGYYGPAPPPVQDLETIRADLVARLQGPLDDLWPAERAKLLLAQIGLSAQSTVVRVEYSAEEPLGDAAAEVLRNGLRQDLGVDDLQLEFVLVNPRPTSE